MEYDRNRLNFQERSERVFLNKDTGNAFISPEACEMHGDGEVEVVTLYRPTLQPIYGSPTLLEALWDEMDRLMEALMTGADAEDGGDRFRAAELAWVLAIVTNAYAPSVDAIRAEAVERWNAIQDQDDLMTRPEGANQ